jgi:hypothetical protein
MTGLQQYLLYRIQNEGDECPIHIVELYHALY